MAEETSEQANGELMRVAEAILDGKPVDWNSEESTHPDLGETLRSLQALEGVAQAHRPEITEMPLRWGPLEIRERIGRGGFGEVYRAYDPALDCEVALKLLRVGERSPREQREFLAEARKLARVDHPNVLRVHGADEHEGRLGIWTELLAGETLEELLATRGVFGADEAASYGMSICRALAAIHRKGLVHQDVKTRNVMRAQGGRIVLMDFGSAGEMEGSPARGAAGHGTPITMSPEQLRGETAGPRADIWGLGVLLYRLVTRRYPIQASSVAELVSMHAAREITPLCDVRSDLPGQFVNVIERALAFDPGERYASAGEMFQALANAIGAVVPRNDGDFRDSDFWKRWGVPIAVAASVAVLAGGYVGWTSFLRHRHSLGSERSASQARSGRPSPISAGSMGSLVASAKLFRESEGAEERLLPGSRVRPGDNLFLQILGSQPMYVYVLDKDDRGRAYALYPGPQYDAKGALAAGIPHRLPGTSKGSRVNWTVTSSGGKETIIVIASRHPQQELEADIASIPVPAPGAPITYGRVSSKSLEVLRGIGGLSPAQGAQPGGGPDAVTGAIRKLYTDSIAASDFWTWQIDLLNP